MRRGHRKQKKYTPRPAHEHLPMGRKDRESLLKERQQQQEAVARRVNEDAQKGGT